MLKIAAPVQLIEQVYDTILNAICDGTFLPGERITQEGLAAQLGVSRQPVVQVVHLLKKQGFIVDAGRKGVMVTEIDPDKLVHLFQIRAALDALAARQAARNMCDNPDIPAMDTGRALVKEGTLLQDKGTTAALIHADMQFHRYIYRLSGNPMIEETAGIHWHHIRRIMGSILKADMHRRARIWAEHDAIFEAICAGKETHAEELARSHAENAAMMLARALRERVSSDTTLHA